MSPAYAASLGQAYEAHTRHRKQTSGCI